MDSGIALGMANHGVIKMGTTKLPLIEPKHSAPFNSMSAARVTQPQPAILCETSAFPLLLTPRTLRRLNMSKREKIDTIMLDLVLDCPHYGHANLVRNAAKISNEVVLGIHPDADILLHKKCLPVFTQEERCFMGTHMRNAARVIPDLPYDFNLKHLDQNGVVYRGHGNDTVISGTGQTLYRDIAEAGRAITLPRTTGIGTTDIIELVLEYFNTLKIPKYETATTIKYYADFGDIMEGKLPAKTNDLFTNDVVYTEGDFDIMTVGHLKFLQTATKLGGSLVVGIRASPGKTLNPQLARARNVMSYKCVDGVVLLPDGYKPYQLVMEEFKHQSPTVVHGRFGTPQLAGDVGLQILDSDSDVRSSTIIQRIERRRGEFVERNRQKLQNKNAVF